MIVYSSWVVAALVLLFLLRKWISLFSFVAEGNAVVLYRFGSVTRVVKGPKAYMRFFEKALVLTSFDCYGKARINTPAMPTGAIRLTRGAQYTALMITDFKTFGAQLLSRDRDIITEIENLVSAKATISFEKEYGVKILNG